MTCASAGSSESEYSSDTTQLGAARFLDKNFRGLNSAVWNKRPVVRLRTNFSSLLLHPPAGTEALSYDF